jgi:hypothetical protein
MVGSVAFLQYAGRIEMNDRLVDACAMELVIDPWQFVCDVGNSPKKRWEGAGHWRRPGRATDLNRRPTGPPPQNPVHDARAPYQAPNGQQPAV